MATASAEVVPQTIGADLHEEQRSDGENSSEADLALNVVPSEKSGRDINRTRRKHHAHEETLAKDEGNFDSDEEQEDARLLEEASGAKIHAQHHAQEDHAKMTRKDAATNLVTCMVGASVLSLPRMVANNGWVLGPAMVVFAGAVSYHACMLVDRALEAIAVAHGTHPRNIGDVVQECFGQSGRRAVLILTGVFQISKCGVYFVVIGTNLNYIAGWVSQRVWAVTGAVLCMRLIFVRDITVISRWSVIGVVASICYLFTITAGGFHAAARPGEHGSARWPESYSDVLADFAVMVYAYSPADVLPVMKHDMKEPQQLRWALRISFLAVTGIYVGLGCVAFLGWGEDVSGNILLSMCERPGCPGSVPETETPGQKWMLGYLLACAVVSNLMVTAPVVLYCVFRVLEAEHSHLLSNAVVNGSLRVVAVMGALMVALFMPYFTEVLAVISTGLLTILQVFVPVAVTFGLSRQGAVAFGPAEFLLGLLGFGMFTVGMSSALRNLHEALTGS